MSISPNTPQIPAGAYRVAYGTTTKEEGKERTLTDSKAGNFGCSLIKDSGSLWQKFLVAIGFKRKIALYDPENKSMTKIAVTNEIFKKIFLRPDQGTLTGATSGDKFQNAVGQLPEMYMLEGSKKQQAQVPLVLVQEGEDEKPSNIDGTLDLEKGTIRTAKGAVLEIKTGMLVGISKDGLEEFGTFKDGKLDGKGTRKKTTPLGIEEESGNFKEGKLEGEGTRESPWETEKGTFEKGKLIDGLRFVQILGTRIKLDVSGGVVINPKK